MFKQPPKRKILIIIGLLITISSIIGISYAYWLFSTRQKDFNDIGTDCFKVTLMNETDGITIDKAHPITDEEGMKDKGYTFTIKNTCNTLAYYQVNLEEIETEVKRLSGEYVKVSLNNSNGEILDHYEKVNPTLTKEKDEVTSDESHKLTSGSLKPAGEEGSSVTYNLKLWMDEETPAIDAVMNAEFKSKITVTASYIEKEKLENKITIAYEEPNDYSKTEEEVTFTVTSENYNIIEYSLDGETYHKVTKPSKNITLKNIYTTEEETTIYFKDEMGNIEEKEVILNKLDQTEPEINVEEGSNSEGALLTITFKDLKSGLKEYKIEDETSSIDMSDGWKELHGDTQVVEYKSETNKKIKIYVRDNLENENTDTFTITKADTKGPTLTLISSSEDKWTNENVTITLSAEDDISGVEKFYYKTESNQEWTEIPEPIIKGKNGNATLTISNEVNETYTFKVEDKLKNASEEQTSVVKIDLTGPSISEFQNTSSTDTWLTTNTLSVNVEDTRSGIKRYAFTTSQEPPTSDSEWTILPSSLQTKQTYTQQITTNGTYYFHTKDELGNTSTSETGIEVNRIDTTEPGASFKVDNNHSTTGSNSWYTKLTITVTATDTESGVKNAKYCVSTSNCDPTNSATLSGGTTSRTFSVEFGSNANAQKVCVSVEDEAGRIKSPICDTVTYKVDKELPTQSFSTLSGANANGWYQSGSITITGNDTGGSNIVNGKCCLTTGTCDAKTGTAINGSSVTVSLSNGANSKVCAIFNDNAGNQSNQTCSSTYNIDGAAPTIGSVSAKSNYYNTLTATANSVTDTGGSGIETTNQAYTFTLNTSPATTINSSSSSVTFTGVVKGTYTVSVTVKDKAGNTSTSKSIGNVQVLDIASKELQNVSKVKSGAGLYEVTTNVANWNTTELRYAGPSASVNNYVTFNGEKWRIIGRVNVQTTSGKITQRLKIIKADVYTKTPWGSSNDWTKASLKTTLNGTYLSEIQVDSKNMIATDIRWNLGGYSTPIGVITSQYYQYERGTTVDQGRPTYWDGQVALMYPSDYGYASSGGSTYNRSQCLAKDLYTWKTGSYLTNCVANDWLLASDHQHVLMPESGSGNEVFTLPSSGYITSDFSATSYYAVRPVVYLKPEVKISGGTGASGSPFALSL